MTTTSHVARHPSVLPTRPSTRRLARSGALAGAIAATGTTLVAVVATAADVSLEVDAAGLSLIPPITAPDDIATTAVLVGAHVLAAAIVIPSLGRQLPVHGNAR